MSSRHPRFAALACLLSLAALPASASTIPFSGPLAFIFEDTGTGRYSGLPIGTQFAGDIDDAAASGMITGAGITTPFSCCIDAGGLSLTNDFELDDGTADLLNMLAGAPLFSAGELIDIVDLEGDAMTAGEGRIEIGLSWLLDAGAFDDDDPANYPFDPSDLRLALFFIFEEDASGAPLYDAVGVLDEASVVTEPASLALLGLGLAGFGLARPRRRRAT